ncbi:dinB superfamily protein [Staphylococcus simiae]|nr:dinB superfamily protein [Staphylococcus simiae]
MMTTKTVFDVINTGVGYITNVYDHWHVAEVLDQQHDVFPNTLHWQFGHVLTIFESALSVAGKQNIDVDYYNQLFGYGSKPADWGQEVPTIDDILAAIKTLPERAQQLTAEDLAIQLPQPVAGCNNLEELLVLNAIHIPLHAGKIEEMSRILRSK